VATVDGSVSQSYICDIASYSFEIQHTAGVWWMWSAPRWEWGPGGIFIVKKFSNLSKLYGPFTVLMNIELNGTILITVMTVTYIYCLLFYPIIILMVHGMNIFLKWVCFRGVVIQWSGRVLTQCIFTIGFVSFSNFI